MCRQADALEQRMAAARHLAERCSEIACALTVRETAHLLPDPDPELAALMKRLEGLI